MLIVMGLAVLLLVVTIVMGKSPTLGLDLQGGVSVNLQPVDESGAVLDDVDTENLDEAIEIIRKRVDAVGVTEPEVSRQGNTITVQLRPTSRTSSTWSGPPPGCGSAPSWRSCLPSRPTSSAPNWRPLPRRCAPSSAFPRM